MMDRHEVLEPASTDEQPPTPIVASPSLAASHIGTNSILDRHNLENESSSVPTPAELSDDDDDEAHKSTSEVDDDASDYDLAQTEEDSDEDIATSRKKHSKNIEAEPLEIEELHEEWQKWEESYTALQHKEKTTQLGKWQREEMRFYRRKLGELFKQIPRSDPLKSTYSKVLNQTSQPETRKRKAKATDKRQFKKPRLPRSRPSNPSTSSGSQNVSRQNVRQHPSHQIATQLQLFNEQGKQAGIEQKKLKSEVKNLELALAALGQDSVTAKDGSWLIEGMKTPLFDYQLDGVGWALRRERTHQTPENPRGGILADQMGCGKTITMLAVMVAKPAPKSYKVKATLLLVQNSAAVRHWQTEIRKHCNEGKLPALCYSQKTGLNKPSLEADQVIIMTYSEIQRAWARIEKRRSDMQNKDVGPEIDQEQSLFDSMFHRLILDECQFVKNHNGATARAVFQLNSRIQWLVSATPAPNSRDEYFPYFKILRLRETSRLSDFTRYWLKGKARPDGSPNIELGLEKFQLHRTHKTKVGGVGILADVPESDEQTQIVTMSDEERAIYDAVVAPVQEEQRELAMKIREQRKNLAENKTIQDDLVRKSKGAFAKILQLHKITAHPFLIETIVRSKDFSATQVAEICSFRTRGRDSALHDQAEDIFAQIKARGLGRSAPVDSRSLVSVTTSHDKNAVASLEAHIDYVLGEKALERKCHHCPRETIPIDAILTECGHAFCREHFDDMMMLSKLKHPGDPESCSVCRKPIGTRRDVDQTIYVEARKAFLAAELSTGKRAKTMHKGEKRERKRGDDFNGYQPRGMASIWLAESDKSHPKSPIVQSSKTRAVLEAIDSWQRDAPDDKIIVFTQWVTMGKVLGRNFEDKRIQFVYYFGEMSDVERNKNLQTFETDPDVKVIIMGFRCGGQGLDMYYANRVILVDPWWNDDGEAQGFARVKRKIQKKETFFLRLLAKDTIDMRVAAIQKSKREMTQRLRQEDDPLKRSEIQMEYTIKACELGLSTDLVETEPIEDAEKTKQLWTVTVDEQNKHEDVKAAAMKHIESESATTVSLERNGKKRGVGDAEGENRIKQTVATSKTSRSDSAPSNQSTDRPIKREDADDTMAI